MRQPILSCSYLLLEVLGIELGWYAKDAVIDRSDVSQFLLLCLPGDEGLPKTVGTKVGPCCKYCMFKCTEEEKKQSWTSGHVISINHISYIKE